MDQVNGKNKPEAPSNTSTKRIRGRPRKDPSQGVMSGVNDHAPPGFDLANGRKFLQLDAIEDSDNDVVGQPVRGVVEAVFDAGYLLSVRIGNSDTNFRGVVFKSGHYAPISAENDVAPHVQMIRRNEISLPQVNQVRTHGRHRRSRGRNARHMPEMSTSIVPSMGTRGTVVPVVLQPVNMSNGVLFSSQAHQVSYQTGHYVQVQPVASHLQSSQPQASNLLIPAGLPGENGPIKSMNQGGASTPPVTQTEAEAAGKSSGEDSDDMDEPLDVEPLRAIHAYTHSRSQPVHKPLEIKGVGRMTELLQAVQENVGGSQLLGAEKSATGNDHAQV